MALELEQLVVSIEAKSDGLAAGMQQAKAVTSDATSAIKRDTGSAADAVARSHNRIAESSNRAGTSQMILQSLIRRSTDQYAAGAPLATILAEHISGLAEAAEFAGGSLGKFGELLAGPFGIAFGLATTAAALLLPKLLEGGDAAKETASKFDAAVTAADSFGNAEDHLGKVIDLTTGKLKTHNQVLIETIRLQAQANILAAQSDQKTAEKALSGSASPTLLERLSDTAVGGPSYGGAGGQGEQINANLRARGKSLAPLKSVLDQYTDVARSYQTLLNAPSVAASTLSKADRDFATFLNGTIARIDDLGKSGKLAGRDIIDLKKQVLDVARPLNDQRANQQVVDVLNGKPIPDDLRPYRRDKTTRPKADHTVEREANRDRALQAEIDRAQQGYASAQAALSDNAQDRLKIELDSLRDARDQRDLEIDDQLTAKKISQADRDLLQKLNGMTEALKETLAIRRATAEQARDTLNANKRSTDNEIALLTISADLATTRAGQLAFERKILADQQAERRATITFASTDPTASKADRDQAAADLKALPPREAAEQRQLGRRYESPITQYFRGLDDPKTQIEQAVADKLRAVDEDIADAASRVLGVKDPFLKSLLQIFLEQNVLKPLYDALSQAKGGGSGGGLLGTIGNLVGSIFGGGGGSSIIPGSLSPGAMFSPTSASDLLSVVPHFASGGGGVIGGNGGIDRNTLSLNGNPIAKVGRGELLSITPPNIGAANQSVASAHRAPTLIQQTIHIDASNSVNPEGFENRILAKSAQVAVELDRHASRQTLEATPGYVSRQQTLKG